MRKGEMPREEMSHAEVASRKEALLAVKGIGCDWNDEKKVISKYIAEVSKHIAEAHEREASEKPTQEHGVECK